MFGFIKKSGAIEYTYGELNTISNVKDIIGDYSYFVDRSNIKVYVIDDEGFDVDPLRSVGYLDIKKYTKFEDICIFKDADVILCDIDGIGVGLDPERQGISVAENLKTIYPDKIVLLYTSKNADEYGGIPEIIDGKIGKGGTMSDLAFEIDQYIKESKDVIKCWNVIKEKMLEKGYSMKAIAFTEHFYCKSLIEKENLFETKTVSEFVNKENIQKFVSVLADIITIYSAMK